VLFFVFNFNGKFLSRAMLSHALGFMYNAIPQIILNHSSQEDLDLNAKLELINNYIYYNVHPYGKVRDDGSSWMLIYGEAWCDSVAAIFIRLISTIDVRGYLIFLQVPDGPSPHSVAYCTPDDRAVHRIDYLQEHGRIVDTQNGIIYQDNGEYLSPKEVRNSTHPIKGARKDQRHLYCEDPKIFTTNNLLSDQPLVKKFFYKRIFPYIPHAILKLYVELAVKINNELEPDEKQYYLARISQLFFDYEIANKKYSEVIAKYSESRWADLANYWKKQLPNIENQYFKKI